MKVEEALKAIRIRLEEKRDKCWYHAKLCGPGQHRDLLNDRASIFSEALVEVGEVEKMLKHR